MAMNDVAREWAYHEIFFVNFGS